MGDGRRARQHHPAAPGRCQEESGGRVNPGAIQQPLAQAGSKTNRAIFGKAYRPVVWCSPACGLQNGAIHLLDVATGREFRRLQRSEGNSTYISCVFSPDGKSLAAAWWDHNKDVSQGGSERARLRRPGRGVAQTWRSVGQTKRGRRTGLRESPDENSWFHLIPCPARVDNNYRATLPRGRASSKKGKAKTRECNGSTRAT